MEEGWHEISSCHFEWYAMWFLCIASLWNFPFNFFRALLVTETAELEAYGTLPGPRYCAHQVTSNLSPQNCQEILCKDRDGTIHPDLIMSMGWGEGAWRKIHSTSFPLPLGFCLLSHNQVCWWEGSVHAGEEVMAWAIELKHPWKKHLLVHLVKTVPLSTARAGLQLAGMATRRLQGIHSEILRWGKENSLLALPSG